MWNVNVCLYFPVAYTMEPSQYVHTVPKEPGKMGFDQVQKHL